MESIHKREQPPSTLDPFPDGYIYLLINNRILVLTCTNFL